jgi:hypothetical protein
MRSRLPALARHGSFRLPVIFILLVFLLATPASAANTLKIYEQTGSINVYTFGLDDIRLFDDTAGLPGPPSLGYIGYDFGTGGCEYYDIFFCDSAGAALGIGPGEPLPAELFLRIECWDISCNDWSVVPAPNWVSAGNNVDAVVLDIDGQLLYGRTIVDAVYGLCDEPFEDKTSNFAESALGPPDGGITKMGCGWSVITMALDPFVPEPPDTTLEHDRLAVPGSAFFQWSASGIEWNAAYDGYVVGIAPQWYEALISGRRFESSEDPLVVFRVYHLPDSSNFIGGYTSSAPADNDCHYSSIDPGIYIHSSGSIRPSWDVNNASYWSTTLPGGYYDVKVALDHGAGTVSFAIDRVAGYSAPLSDFSAPEWSAVEYRTLEPDYSIQLNPYNEKSRIYDVWSAAGGELPPPPPLSPPLIIAVEDIGNDDGGQVRLRWSSSSLDIPNSTLPITGYALWRRIDPLPPGIAMLAAQAAPALIEQMPLYPPGDWDYLGTVPACCEETYATVVPTLADSTAEYGVHWSVFFVRALTQVPAVYYDSPPDSGYSIGPEDPIEPGQYPEPEQQADYLGGNYPNPFNPATEIRFGLASPGHVVVRIYEASGRLVRTLVDRRMPAGDHTAVWNGIDDRGRAAASGVYFCRLEAERFTKTEKMVLMR